MSEVITDLLDLGLAWERAKADIPHRVFIRHPYEIKLIELDLGDWLHSLSKDIRDNRYSPKPLLICDVPKPNGLIRPGGHLSFEDKVVFAACVGACFPQIYQTLSWSQGTVDFSYQLSTEPDDPKWFRNRFRGWEDFRLKSLSKISEGISYVIFTDISGFYENVEISILISDLNQIHAQTKVVELLSTCLNRWSQGLARGIPQGHSPSDILAKIYLNSIDRNLESMNFTHYRYVDDFRIFCHSMIEAKRALVDITRLLRERGLSPQSAKTEILRADEARKKIEGVRSAIDTVRQRLVNDAKALRQRLVNDAKALPSSGNPYISMGEAEEILAKADPDDIPLELIQETYQTYFIDSPDDRFDKTLFHFLLKRLAKFGDRFAVEHCKTLFDKRPEETEYILDYFFAVNAVDEVEDTLVEFLNSEDAIYPYQIYQIVEWRGKLSEQPSGEFLAIARRLTFDNSQPHYLLCACRKLLGDFGLSSDLERLLHLYTQASSQVEQSELICSLKRVEKGRRNSFLNRASGDGELNKRAAELVKTGRI